MTKEIISNSDNMIDSRDLIKFIEKLGEDTDATNGLFSPEEIKAFKAFAKEFEDYSGGYKDGSQAIRDSYFKEYAQEFAEEIGSIDTNNKWPNNCIDWDYAARELQYDYNAIDFDGVTYWVR